MIAVRKVGKEGKSFVISNFTCFQCGVYSRAAFISKSVFFKSLTTVIVNRLQILCNLKVPMSLLFC